MLGLKLPTDPRWVNIVEKNISDILTDHAYCEQKAASYAISLITKYPDIPEIVEQMTALAQEELEHFQMVHAIIIKRGLCLGRESKDPYVHDLMKFIKRGGNDAMVLVDRLLIAAMIEARSCERFRVLSENINDKELASFYRDLMASEAKHYTLFLKLARKYGKGVDVEKRWKEFLAKEAEIMKEYGKKVTVHG
ncbi:MAG: tRNA 2-methylthio-N6-isopentenyl adenosine(37) hydroxylase MiaE [Flavobacteriales bacterium]|nr:tRNA 2-methylthio-N6-isopentenyl adenosine(37) hydroxylase MiaE [Flavobacteriales bacterium]|tara:strand:- start:17172 stop:17753 length:582 start_codon:yes stop_codon:yes gene_type:complete